MSSNNNSANSEINNNDGTEHLTEILNEDGNDNGNMEAMVSKLKINNRNTTDNNDNENSSSVKKSTSSKNIAISTLLATLAKLIETSSNVVDANATHIDNVEEITSKSKLDARSSCQMGGSETSHLTLVHPQSSISTGSIICRICHNNENIDRLISPCLCKGSLAYVHRYCVEYWLSRSGTLHCELCMHPFNTRNTLRYGFFESLRIWYRHPNNRGLLQSDVLTCALLTVVSLGLIAMSFLSLRYFMMQGARIGLSRFWTQSSIIMFLCIVLFAYSINLFFIVRGQIIPWYRWWRSARHVHLILDPV